MMFEDVPRFSFSMNGNIKDPYYYIYSITNKRNGKKYIGRTLNPRQRFLNHYNAVKNKKHPNIKDCNVDDLVFEIMESHIRYEESKTKERLYMGIYMTYQDEFGYNTRDPFFHGRPSTRRHINVF